MSTSAPTKRTTSPWMSWVRLIASSGLNTAGSRFRVEVPVSGLPPGVNPQLSPFTPTGELVRYSLTSPKDALGRDLYTLNDLKALQDWTLQRELLETQIDEKQRRPRQSQVQRRQAQQRRAALAVDDAKVLDVEAGIPAIPARGERTELDRLPDLLRKQVADLSAMAFELGVPSVEGLIRKTRSGKLNSSQFGERMKGAGLIAEQIADTFRLFRRKHGLDQPMSELDFTQFRPPKTTSGQLRLF